MASMQTALITELQSFLNAQTLPEALMDDIRRFYLPFSVQLADQFSNQWALKKMQGMQVLGINGAQGSGKSTLAGIFKRIFELKYGWTVALLSLDDLYVSRAARRQLAADIHPLLQTRGVPGTHDVQLGVDTIAQLAGLKSGQTMRLPRFDKAHDEPFAQHDWPVQQGPVDLLIFEGWCVCANAQTESELDAPCNALEVGEDADGVWRRFVNRQLSEHYPALFAPVDVLMYLQVPDMQAVHRWRSTQEAQLIRMNAIESNSGSETMANAMDAAAMHRFIQHFERLTLHQRNTLPDIADVVCELDASHGVRELRYRDGFKPAQ